MKDWYQSKHPGTNDEDLAEQTSIVRQNSRLVCAGFLASLSVA